MKVPRRTLGALRLLEHVGGEASAYELSQITKSHEFLHDVVRGGQLSAIALDMGAPFYYADGIRNGLEQAYRRGLVEIVDQELAPAADKYFRMSQKQVRSGPIKRVTCVYGNGVWTHEYRTWLRAPFVRSRLRYRLNAELIPIIVHHEVRFGGEMLIRYKEPSLDVRILH